MISPREELVILVRDHNLTQSSLAKEFGVSTSLVSQYLDGTYTGDTEKIDRKVKAFIANFLEEKSTDLIDIPVVKTSVFRNLFDVAHICHVTKKIGIAYGPAGIGKTKAVHEYCKENPGVILIEADPVYSERDLFRALYRTLIGGEPQGSIHEMFEACVKRLSGTKRMIIVDEAENLPYKALELLRRVWDKAHIGVLMVGMERLRSNLIGKQREYAQLFSRVSISKNLGALLPQDTELIIESALPEYKDLWEVFHEESNANARNLENLLINSISYSRINKKDITAKLIRNTAQTLII
jgi:hypothetical protein